MIPGQAFGSGTHPTTQLALRRLEHSLRPGARVLDFGAGSGILSFAAALLGAREIVAIEVDAECEENFRENLALNPPPDARVAVKFRVGSSERIAPGESFDLIVCNALFNRVKNHFAALARALAPGGIFIYSGFMDTEDDEVLGLLRSLKLRMMSEDQLQEWGLVESRRETGDGVS
jgi:ribosomal protein L11 methyltransferase